VSFERNHLPDPVGYYTDAAGLALQGRGTWRTTRCEFHDGSDSMRINIKTGAFRCMAECGARGGDVLAYHMAAHCMEFIEAAKTLGAWVDDGKGENRRKPTVIPARDMLEIAAHEIIVASLVASDLAHGREVSETDRERLTVAAGRLGRIAEEVRNVA
jgi:hypothetical protein